MKIQTKDCVAELNKHSNRKWKRYTKNTVLFQNEPVDLREFHNKEDNLIGFVWATDNLIVKVIITEPSDTDKVLVMWNGLKDARIKDGNWSTNDFVAYDFINVNYDLIETIPTSKLYMDHDANGKGVGTPAIENQDFENVMKGKANENTITCYHGGDWQTPITVTYRLMKNGLYYADFKTLIRHNEE